MDTIRKINRPVLISIVLLTVGIVVTYYPLFNSYFEQDEWAVFADMTVFGSLSFSEKLRFLFRSSSMLSHMIPISMVVSFILNSLYGLTFSSYAATSVVLHTLNSILVFAVSYRLTKRILIALSTGLLFGIHNLSSQAVTWLAASLGAQLSTIFFLVSLLLYQEYLIKKRSYLFVASVLVFICSLLSKETTLPLLIVYPLIYLAQKKIPLNIYRLIADNEIRKTLWYVGSIGALFLGKYILSIINPHPHPAVVGSKAAFEWTYILKLFMYPLEAVSQALDPGGVIFTTSKRIIAQEYAWMYTSAPSEKIAETMGADLISLLFSAVLLLTVGLLYFWSWIRYPSLKKLIALSLGSLILFFVATLSYVPLPKFTAFLEPRYYYTPQLFMAFWVITTLTIGMKSIRPSWIRVTGIGMIVFLLVYANYRGIQGDLSRKVHIAGERKQIISKLVHLNEKLYPSANVFYITGEGEDYLIPGLKIPFQSGFGNVLMVIYRDDLNLPAGMFDDGYLYQLDDQGYREVEGHGFGYYYVYADLENAYHNKEFPLSALHAYSWEEERGQFNDITETIRSQLTSL